MYLPSKLKILGHIYQVREVEGMVDEGNTNNLTILINKELPQTLKEETLLHEIIHTINGELKETDVEFLAQTLYQVLKDNHLW